MTAQLRIDQEGIPNGEPGKSRTDGLDNGAIVHLINMGGGATTFRLLWVPPGDETAVESLAPTGDETVWTFLPSSEVYGSYRIELIANEGLPSEKREVRILGIRTPRYGLLIPAFNERGDPRASLAAAEAAQIEAAENNADDFGSGELNTVRYAAWWRALHELVMKVDGFGSAIQTEGIHGVGVINAAPSGLSTQLVGTSGTTAHEMLEGSHQFKIFDTPVLEVTNDLADTKFGFFGATPVVRPSITGVTTQQQIDSIVAALAALGLATDDR